jgi:hypothetical protein
MALPRGTRLAAALWIAFAIVAWNVVFDRVIVVGARDYLAAARQAEPDPGAALLISDWMPPAIQRALWSANAVGGAIALIGLAALAFAIRAQSSTSGALSESPEPSAEDIACAPRSIR